MELAYHSVVFTTSVTRAQHLLLVQGVSPRVVMDLLGHSQIGLTMNTYSHVIPDLRRDAALRIEELLTEHDR